MVNARTRLAIGLLISLLSSTALSEVNFEILDKIAVRQKYPDDFVDQYRITILDRPGNGLVRCTITYDEKNQRINTARCARLPINFDIADSQITTIPQVLDVAPNGAYANGVLFGALIRLSSSTGELHFCVEVVPLVCQTLTMPK
jgi:hypothetical protein